MKKIGGLFLLFIASFLLFSPSTFACELQVNVQGIWVDENGVEASEEAIAVCDGTSEESTTDVMEIKNDGAGEFISFSGKVMIVVTLLFMLSIPLFFIALLIVVIFAVSKKPLKGPLIFLAVTTALPALLYLFSIA